MSNAIQYIIWNQNIDKENPEFLANNTKEICRVLSRSRARVLATYLGMIDRSSINIGVFRTIVKSVL